MLSVISFMLPSIFIKHLLCARNWAKPCGSNGAEDKPNPCLHRAPFVKKKDTETHNYNKGSWGSGKRKYIWEAHSRGICNHLKAWRAPLPNKVMLQYRAKGRVGESSLGEGKV